MNSYGVHNRQSSNLPHLALCRESLNHVRLFLKYGLCTTADAESEASGTKASSWSWVMQTARMPQEGRQQYLHLGGFLSSV
jgi:hypothetical protein